MAKRFVFACVLGLCCADAIAQDEVRERVRAALDLYTSDDTLAVGVIEIDSQWIAGVQQTMSERLGVEGNRMANNPGFAMSRGFVEGFRAAGAREAVIIAGLNDLTISTGPAVVLTTDTGEQARAVADLAQSLLGMGPGDVKDLQAVVHENSVLIGQPATLERYQAATGGRRDDIAEALEPTFDKSNDVDRPVAGFVYAPGDDARRVIRDLWPQLPAPFVKLDGKLVGDDIDHVRANVTAPPEWQLEVVISSSSESAAKTIEQLIGKAWNKAAKWGVENNEIPELVEVVRRAAQILTAEQEGTAVTIRATHDDSEVEKFVESIMLPALTAARADASRMQRMNQFKRMALAMLNFHDVAGHFPASSAIVDEDGKPLLSWRVAILPYLEQQALYNEFRLDEPWDSPHNLKLAKTIPSVYVDPAHRSLAAEGKTTYQLPVHERSVFPPLGENASSEKKVYAGREVYLATGTSYRDITDGTSNTVMIVQTPPEDAIVWTKPADWEVDLARAWQQLRGDRDDVAIVSAFCDGSARAWGPGEDVLEERLPQIITRDGKEVIKW